MAGFLAGYRQMGTQMVVIIQNEGTQDEKRFEAECFVQPERGTFELETPIYEGDIVEMDDPRGGRQRRVAQDVKQYPRKPQRTRVTWGNAAPVRTAPIRRLQLENLHADVISAASNLFADGHYAAAVSEAFKSIEVRVRNLANITDQSGSKLMGQAFGTSAPRLDVSTETGQSGKDEQEGYQQLFRGAMLGVRNPKAHELFRHDDPQQALEYLGFASLLHRRLDIAEAKLTP
ncbi:MAG: hypothetical protein QOJ56_4992 [Mycobacterium sp.]|jgi:uncharacterized protein (TIGR02391 family)|nr:hypothetical protein [Mycobacterium sp.]MDT5356460.1 hypothetical protein [Mycobacterium sp.]